MIKDLLLFTSFLDTLHRYVSLFYPMILQQVLLPLDYVGSHQKGHEVQHKL